MVIRTIKVNLARIFQSPSFYICILAIALVNYSNFYSNMMLDGYTDMASSVIHMDSGFSITNWVLCIVGGGLDYCKEVKNGYLYFNVARNGVKTYSIGKIIAAGIGGFVCACFGLLLHNLAAFFTIFYHTGNFQKTIIKGTEQTAFSVVSTLFLMIFGISLFCALLSMFGLMVTTIVSDYFMGVAMPILAYHCYAIIVNRKNLPDFLNLSVVYYYPAYLSDNLIRSYLYALLLTCCAGYIFYRLIVRNIGRRLEHV